MRLCCKEVRMTFYADELNELLVRRTTSNIQAILPQNVMVRRIDFISMAVPFTYHVILVESIRF